MSHAEQVAAVLIYLRQLENVIALLGGFSAELSAVWVCTDPDCAQFRREAPEKGDNVFELAQVNQYGCDLFRVAHRFVYLNEDVDENERESLVSMYGWDEDDLYSDEFNGILAEAVFETSAAEYDTSAEYSSFEAAARALGHLIDVDIGKYLQI